MDKLDRLDKKLNEVLNQLQQVQSNNKEVFNLQEAAGYLCMATSTLYKHTSAGNIAHYKPNGKLILFQKSDLDQWLSKSRVPSNTEIESSLTESELP